MSQPDETPPPAPEPSRKRPRPRAWLLIASAVFAGLVAAVIALAVEVGNAPRPAANAAAAHSATPSSLSSELNAAAACNSSGGSWNGSSCGPAASAPSIPTGAPTLSPGQPEQVTVGNSSQTAATITVESVNVTTQAGDGTGTAPANGWYVVVQVKATCAQSYTGGFPVNSTDFYDLVAGIHYSQGNGNAYDALSSAQSNEDVTATLAAGETSAGWMAFDVPARHGVIVYAPNSNGQPIAEWSY